MKRLWAGTRFHRRAERVAVGRIDGRHSTASFRGLHVECLEGRRLLTAFADCIPQATVAPPAVVAPASTAPNAAQTSANTEVSVAGLDITMVATTWIKPNSHPTPGDANRDGRVNALDIALVKSQWLDGYSSGDVNDDGRVNVLDLAVIKSHWLQTGPDYLDSMSAASNSATVVSNPTAPGVSAGAATLVAAGGTPQGVEVLTADSHIGLSITPTLPAAHASQPCGQNDPAIGTGGLIVRIPQLIPITNNYSDLLGDANQDKTVNSLDIAAVRAHWLMATSIGDANFDGRVDALDLAAIESHWLQHQDGGTGLQP